jgi:hypothetical protein
MIKVHITKENDLISILEMKGHSGYDTLGRDIVCAGASTIIITTINAIIRYDENAISYNQDEGYVKVEVHNHSQVVDLLLENAVSLLKELETQYKKNIKINE